MAVETRHDPALQTLLASPDPEAFSRNLETVLAGVDRVVREAIRRTLRSHAVTGFEPKGEDVDDLRGETVLLLMRRLRELQTDESSAPIQNFSGYAATVASRVCYTYLRRRYPEWTRLKNQVRYVCTHDPELALRLSSADASLCVLTSWSDAAARERGELASDVAHALGSSGLPLRELVKHLLRRAGGPVELNDLVGTIARIRGVRDSVSQPVEMTDIESLRAPAPPPGDDAGFLKQMWEEVRQLPLRQRIALLLNLRDDRGRGVLALFSLTGTASMRKVAEALGMTADELVRLWAQLPMDDRSIAGRLNVTRQQVINLRKSARARLGRRLAAYRVGV